MNRLITIITLLVALALGSLGASGATKRVTLKYKPKKESISDSRHHEPMYISMDHCDFGWGGDYNGYYIDGIFNLNSSKNIYDGIVSGRDCNFRHHVKILYYDL